MKTCMEHFLFQWGGTGGGRNWGGKRYQRADLHTCRTEFVVVVVVVVCVCILMVLERVIGMLIDSTSSQVSAMSSQKSKVDAEPATTRDANPDRTIILEQNWTVYKK